MKKLEGYENGKVTHVMTYDDPQEALRDAQTWMQGGRDRAAHVTGEGMDVWIK